MQGTSGTPAGVSAAPVNNEIHSLIEDYKVRCQEIMQRSAQYERLWLVLVTVLGGLLAWAFQYNLSKGNDLFDANVAYAIIPILILVWFVFVIYVSAYNRLLTLYAIKLEGRLREIIMPSGVADKNAVAFTWKSDYQQFIQETSKIKIKSFGVLYVILGVTVLLVFLLTLCQTVAFLRNAGKADFAMPVGITLGFLGLLLVIFYFTLYRKVREKANQSAR